MRVKKIISIFKNNFINLLPICILAIFYLLLYKIFMPRVNAFGCFDDCFNYLGGYFILKGKQLYSQIFFNHQPFMAYLSYVVQLVKDPQNIYELLLVHRQFLLIFSFIINLILLIRFKWPILGFVIFYELTKYYIFGDRFLAEAFIVYPIVYIGGLVFYKIQNLPLRNIDYILSAIFTTFIIFMREPYIPLILFLFAAILIGRTISRIKKISIALFTLIITIILFQLPIKDYLYEVVTVSSQTALKLEIGSDLFGWRTIESFIYPIFLFFTTKWNIFQQILAFTNIIFLFLTIIFWVKLKSKTLVIIIFFILGLANLRIVEPGTMYYGAFHLIQWYGLFLFYTFIMIGYLIKKEKKTALTLIGILIFSLLYFSFIPSSYLRENVNTHSDFITNYGRDLQIGEVVKNLSNSSDTFFQDGSYDLTIWQSDRLSPYKYSLFIPVMESISFYEKEKINMFSANPPDFYYDQCPKEKEQASFQVNIKGSKYPYIRLYEYNSPSCLLVNKQKISQITYQQWQKAKEFGYTLQQDASFSKQQN